MWCCMILSWFELSGFLWNLANQIGQYINNDIEKVQRLKGYFSIIWFNDIKIFILGCAARSIWQSGDVRYQGDYRWMYSHQEGGQVIIPFYHTRNRYISVSDHTKSYLQWFPSAYTRWGCLSMVLSHIWHIGYLFSLKILAYFVPSNISKM